MATQTNLGIATAYGYAKSKGYTGTEEEFAELMASYASVAQQAAASASQAATSANNAALSASSASGSETAASGSASAASLSASAASGSATAAGNSAKDSEAYAVGKRAGTDVGSTDPAYHNNAKYYANEASGAVADAVAAKEAAQEAAASASAAYGTDLLAPDFAQETANPAGSHVIYNGGIYLLPEGHAAGTTWANTSKTQITVGGELSTLKSEIDELEDVLVDEVSSSTTLSPIATESRKLLYFLNEGNITDGTLDNQRVYAYNIEGYDGLHFNFYGRVAGENNYAFYSADSLGGCDSTTVLGAVTAYTSAGADNFINAIPSGAKIVVIGARQDGVMRGITNSIVSKADTALADPYSTTTVYSIGDYCTYGGKFYRRTTYTGAYGAWDASEWEQTKPAKELDCINDRFKEKQYFDHSLFQVGGIAGDYSVTDTIKYQVVNTNLIHVENTITLDVDDLFELTIYYYTSNGIFISNNGGLSTFDARTIMEDSYVRLKIGKKNVQDTLSTNDIPIFVNALSFDSNYKKTQEKINENSEGAMKALEAVMFQKGGSPVSFANAPCILVAGQSNIDGRVPKADLPSSITPPFANIKNNFNNNSSGVFADSMALPASFGIDFSLYSALNNLGTPWYVIKRSMGGTSISPYGDSTYHWTPFYEELDDISKSLLFTFNKQISKCEEANPNTFNFRALIWQQGEGDRASTSKKAAIDYYKNFRCLVAYIRGITGNEKLPVVCGTVSHLSGQYDPIVEEATLKVAEEDPYMTCIDMSGATLLDSYHFDADCAIYFGYKAYDALIDFGVISGTKINPECPWENT